MLITQIERINTDAKEKANHIKLADSTYYKKTSLNGTLITQIERIDTDLKQINIEKKSYQIRVIPINRNRSCAPYT